jgi:hypothetical protein
MNLWPDEASKNKAHELSLTEELKIYKKDYLIEVSSVPLSVHVAYEKRADNTHLATAICEASRTVSSNL